MMTNGRGIDHAAVYEIKVIGNIDENWSDWFDGFTIINLEHETLLRGKPIDQAALLGMLTKIVGLGLTLVSVHRLKEELR